MAKMDLAKVKTASDAIGALNDTEFEFLLSVLEITGRKGLGEAQRGQPPAEPAARRRGPDPRGRYKCRYCDKVLPTKRGRGIHENAHDKQTAPEGKP